MPEKGWRKRFQEKRPKTPVQQKATASFDDAASLDDQFERISDRFRLAHAPEKPSWRSYLGSRPQTPIPAPTVVSTGDDTEDSRSEASSDRGRSGARPKVSRYLSDYLALSAPPKAPVKEVFLFSEPWCEEERMEIEPPVDPLVAVQEIRLHIGKQSWVPLPVEHNNGLLRIFEDYRKVRDTKELLDVLMKDILGAWQTAQEEWTERERRYQHEIRRLELLIAQGSTGMAGLIKARQGTIVDRNRTIRRIRSTESPKKLYDSISSDQLDDEIRQRSQKGENHHP